MQIMEMRPAIACAVMIGLLMLTLSGCGNRDDASRLAELMQVKPGSTVADFGAGKGALALSMANIVGSRGRVFATEIDPGRLAAIRRSAEKQRHDNLIVIEGGEKDTHLPRECCDAIYMRGVYHHLTDPTAIDASLYRALRPGGLIAVQDFRPTWLLAPWTPAGIPANRGGHGVRPEIVIDEMTAAGFKEETDIDPWKPSWFVSNYCLLFRKPIP